MKVFFDHQCFWESFGGVSRAFTEILKTKYENADYKLALRYSNNIYLKELPYVVPALASSNGSSIVSMTSYNSIQIQ